MPYAVELLLDSASESIVRRAWNDLAAARVGAPNPHLTDLPHVSLAVADELDVEDFLPALGAMAESMGPLPLTLSYAGVFMTTRVLFLGVAFNEELHSLHNALHRNLRAYASGVSDYYKPGSWVPHVTLAREIPEHDTCAALDACRSVELPIDCVAESLCVVDIASGRIEASWRLTASAVPA